MASDKAHKLYPHGDLESPIGGVWMVTGRSAFPLYRRMTVWKLPDGTLLAHSVIAMDDARMAALDALGRLSIILVPNSIHRLDAGFYKKRYPDARVVAPAAARAKVEAVIAVDALAEDELPRHGITVHPLPGWKHGEVGYELALPGGGRALVLSDVLTNANPVPGFGGWVSSNITTGGEGPPRRRAHHEAGDAEGPHGGPRRDSRAWPTSRTCASSRPRTASRCSRTAPPLSAPAPLRLTR